MRGHAAGGYEGVPVLPDAAGMWTSDAPAANMSRAVVGIIGLGYVLFGIRVRPMLAVIGVGIVAAFFVPSYLFDAATPSVTTVLTMAVSLAGMLWLRKRRAP